MIQPTKHFAVNWTEGMKVSLRHFTSLENYITDMVRDADSLYLNSFNYGLLPAANAAENVIFEVLGSATNDVQLTIKNCNAVTPAGLRIELSDYNTNVKTLAKVSDMEDGVADAAYYILISVNPFSKVPFGDIDPEEAPPRKPYTKPKYHIELVSASTTNQKGGNYLIVGKVNIKDNTVHPDTDFIPPCTSIHSHPALLKYYGAFAKSIGNLQQYAFKIIQKTIGDNQNTTLAGNVKAFCRVLIDHLASVYFRYRNIIPQEPPALMIEVFSRMALHLYDYARLIVPGELEEMLSYSFEWSEIAPHTLLNQLSDVSEISYDHNDCGTNLLQVQALLNNLEIILEKLSNLDYIGQRKENIIVNEQNITPAAKIQKGWSILD